MFLLTELYSRLMVLAARLVLRLNPQRSPVVFSGEGSANRLSEAIAGAGCRHVLVVTDKVLVELGIVASVVDTLSTQGVKSVIYDGILPDPTNEQIIRGVELLQQQRFDAVLAIGGGSSLDAAKIIALQPQKSLPLERISGFFRVPEAGLPLFAVPTTAGTGSEATMASVITDEQSATKVMVIDPILVPHMAALDPSLMLGMPPPVTAATGIDALTHALESLLSRMASANSRYKAGTAARMIFANLEQAYTQGDDIKAREAMAVASFLAGSAFTESNLGYVHAIAHQIGAIYHIPHGVANAVVLPHVLDFYRQDHAHGLASAARAAGLGEPSGNDNELSAELISRVRQLIKAVGIAPTVVGMREQDCDMIVGRALKEAHGLFGYPVPAYMRPEQCKAIVRKLVPRDS